jgi:apolipoprotein N-acyltransferase
MGHCLNVGRYAACAGAGLALLLAFPPYGLWWLAPVGVAVLTLAVHGRRARGGAAGGLLAGLVFFVPLLAWTARFVDTPPWLLLAGLQAAYLAGLGAAAAWVSPLVERHRWAWPPVTALLWVAQEALRARTPFGGFPWGRLAFSQGDSPLLRLAALGGAPLVTFAVALAGGLLAAAVYRPWRPAPLRSLRAAAGPAGGAALVVLAGLAVPAAPPGGPAATVAVVQGNVPRLGLDFNAQRRAVLDNHVQATLALAEQVRSGQRPQPDLVVWPENSSDIDPLRNRDAGARIDAAAQAVGAPILVGALLEGPGPDEVRNVGLVWTPAGTLGDVYVKRHPVPFAEYLPWRPVLAPVARLVAAQADLLRSDFSAGGPPGVLRVGPARVGTVICFEVAYDSLVRDTVVGGAQLLSVQTNNATFDEAEARQQLAMVRLRAVEHGRDSLMASTVGVSGFVAADGAVHSATGFDTPAVIVRDLHLRGGRTLATRLGAGPELALTALALAALVAATVYRRRTVAAPPASSRTAAPTAV